MFLSIVEIKEEYAKYLAEVFDRDFTSWKEMMETDFDIGSGVSKVYGVEELMEQVAMKYASQFQERIEELEGKFTSILYMSEERGVEGCTYGDTDMSSTDVAYGYNLALEYVKKEIGRVNNKESNNV